MDIRLQTLALREERMNVFNQLQAELDATAGRERSAEEATKIERMDARIDEIDAEVRDLDRRFHRENEAATLRAAQETAWGAITEERTAPVDPNAELRAFLRGGAGNMINDAGHPAWEVDIRGAARERQLLRSGANAQEIRALAWDTGSSGSLVPTNLARSLYQYLEASIAMFRMPTTKIETSDGAALEFPKLGAHAIATQVSGQGTTLAGTDPSFLKMHLDAFKYGELVIVANEMLSDTVIDISSFLGKDLGRALGRKVDVDLVAGSGSGAPNGLMTAIVGAGTISTGGSLITPTAEVLISLQYSVADEYRSSDSACWLMNDSSAGTLRKLRDGAGGTVGAFLWAPSLTQGLITGQPDRFLDKHVYTDPNVAAQGSNAKTIAFGDMSAYYVRTVGNPVIESDSSRYFDTDQTGFRAKWRVDGDLIDTLAVNAIKQSV